MAAGRHSGYREHEFRDKDSDVDQSRRKEYYQDRERRGGHDHRDRARVRPRDVKEREALNGASHSPSGFGNSSGGKAGDHHVRSRFHRGPVDREPGELSSGSSSDDPELSVSMVRDNSVINQGNGVLSSKRRKFSPIIWDRDDGKLSAVTNSKSKNGHSIEQVTLPPLPPPPQLPEGFVPVSSINSVQLSADHAPTINDVKVSVDSPQDQQNHDQEPGVVDEDEEDFSLAPNISTSRWADSNNALDDDDDDDENGDVKQDFVPKRRRNTPLANSMEQRLLKAPSPEVGEVISASKSSGSEGERRDTDHEVEVDKNVYMDVDEDAANGNVAEHLSDTDSDDDVDMTESPKTAQPPQRCINMLLGCRSVDEFERLNKIDEGTYGVVYRARDKKTGEVVALKKVKMEKEREGFPLTSLREINVLLSFHHPSIVDVKEVVVGSSLDSIFMVMEYMEHDLKGLMETMKQPFSQSEVKCLMLQLLEGVKYLHDNWVLHRDLKTSNLLMNNRGELKICDFGLARQYGSPLKPYTHLVVTLWYRAPELLLGIKEYSTAIDMWSLGCIMAELLAKEPLFNGKTELDQLDKIFRTLGTPNEKIWPGFAKLPGLKVSFVKQPYNKLREKFPATCFSGRPTLSEAGFDLLNKLLTYDPEKRITAEAALNHAWFREVPLPKSKDFMPTFPAQHAQDRRLRRIMKSPDPLEEQRLKELKQGELGPTGLFG
ncbi:[RNA-polymerase]-subunit kinase protein [Dioscorea alata]|uniref:[RNA-polymerase]-subunit kinase protein n=3 Tax=Dioscorea alata TaxID=55571 RepID=A0ACB7UU22_DIOAL|nr:[RNA-polymerase]-subunit kinase protein [Dioscorea alata]KAH7664187.1 [RNA-polymerase]-subunit kinase protein [Dioscorea alata]KAH7664188.1 [RNA-polymerase]-subunit kinase protein [Dioscorea alata]